ncbi:peptide MFS transporter [Methanobrevibacter sp.]|uniref:peptide MFS transporter n=1 Tax=Methanobrevibacter sp. TaxID=66852 RepID=UPI00388FF535
MGHPKGIYLLSSTAMLESMSYYIFAGLLVMYMIDVLHFTDSFSTSLFGIAFGSTYVLQMVGGYVCDRYLGNRKAIIFGISLIVIAQLIFSYDASLFALSAGVHEHAILLFTYPEIVFLAGVAVMAVGVSFFKVNIASFMDQFYNEGESKLIDSAFSIFYLFINVGGLIAPLLINSVVGVHHPELYQYGFLIGFAAIFLGLLVFAMAGKRFFRSPDGEPLGVEPRFKTQAAAAEDTGKLSKAEIDRFKVIIAILISAFVFQLFCQQVYTSIILFAESNVNNVIPFINQEVAPSFYLSLNPLFIIFLTPVYLRIFNSREISSITKIGVGLLLLGAAYSVLFIAMGTVGSGMKLSMYWVFMFNFCLVNSEMLTMPVTLSAITKLTPEKYVSSMIGVYYVTFSIASVIAGACASAFPNDTSTMLFNIIPIVSLQEYFIIFAMLGFVAGGIWMIFRRRMIRMSEGIL